MRAIPIVSLIVLAGCAATAKDFENMPAADVCYRAMSDSSEKATAEAELQRRRINCQDYTAEIKKIQDIEQRTGQMGGGVGEGTPKPSGGGMGRGY